MAQQPSEEEQPPVLFVHLLQTSDSIGNPPGRGTEKKKNVFSKLLLSKPKSVKQTNKDTFKQAKKNLEIEFVFWKSFYSYILVFRKR
jgi:uncharacterized pyridoxamine 5'-phosphate oxidase family protein